MFKLAYQLNFQDLYFREGLLKIDALFCDFLAARDADLYAKFLAGRKSGFVSALDESDAITAVAPILEEFIGVLFGIEKEVEAQRAAHSRLDPIYECKRQFVQRRAAKKFTAEEAEGFDGAALRAHLGLSDFSERAFAEKTLSTDETILALAERYAAWALHSKVGREFHKKHVLFRLPKKIDPQNLVPVQHELRDGYRVLKSPEQPRPRDGFNLTDAGGGLEFALDQAHYCIFCHKQGKDSCAKGLRDKATGAFQKSAQGVELAGCPLEEKISEMNMLKASGHSIASLAAAAIDNPLCAMTGHRICNDCMKSCIYQKQEPVDIPQIETQTLKDVLALPWGFEIYSLLTRWNPLNFERPVPRAATGRNILVAGAGPAGINLSHHLLNDGHSVCLIDGLKIEPLDIPFEPIRDASSLRENLSERVMAGFGGVAEYGITVRWDKNFLKIVRLLLQRREEFDLYGGVRFGGTITAQQAFDMGFDHVALCLGAGRPTLLDVPGNLAKGVRAASDFLMALQLTGAAKRDSIANLQIRLPAVIIGGGLTAIDTATEVLAYYPLQVEKFLVRYESLAQKPVWNDEEKIIVEEFIAHARALRAEKSKQGIMRLLQQWGGATIAYRRDFESSPSYTLNHEEVHKAMEEGIFFAPNLTPAEIQTDAQGWARSVHFAEGATLPARSVLVAAGTQPNTVLAREDETLRLSLDGKYFQAYDETGYPVSPRRSAKPDAVHIMMHRRADGRTISFFGDLHPSFSGNVVKAMASAKRGYPLITRHLQNLPAVAGDIKQKLRDGFSATVREVKRLTPSIVEVVLRAPFAAANFQPGQFYRLQNFETNASLAMEGLAMTGAWVDSAQGLISIIALEMGGSSDLCARLKQGEAVVLMGPTGAPTEIPSGETVVLVGGGLGNAVLFSIGQAMRRAGNKVIYFAGYKSPQDRFKPEEIEAASDTVIWACDTAPGFAPSRQGDRGFTGNIVAAMRANKDLLSGAQRLICIGSDRMMAAVALNARELMPDVKAAIGSINSPMQCMMKEICAQCVQRHIDPKTGKEEIVFSCFNQDQDLAKVDWQCLNDRLRQNGAQEKLTAAWIASSLSS